MATAEAITEGFRLIHRNWQLILIHFLISVLSFLGFLIIIGIPLIVAIVVMGIDLAAMGVLEDMVDNVEDPLTLLNNYMGLIVIAGVCLLVYLIFAFSIFIFGLGGSAGTIASSLREHGLKFSTSLFISEGKRWFFPLMGFTALVGLIYIGALVVLAVGGGLTALAWGAMEAAGSTIGLFLKVFATLSLTTAFLATSFGSVVVTAGGIAVMVLEGTGAVKALGGAFRYIDKRPGIVWLMFLLFVGYMVAQITFALMGYPLQLIPIVGMFVVLPYQLLAYVLQGYLSLVILASVFAHYHITIAGGSTREEDTSPEAVSV
jgi:hypothetical protein